MKTSPRIQKGPMAGGRSRPMKPDRHDSCPLLPTCTRGSPLSAPSSIHAPAPLPLASPPPPHLHTRHPPRLPQHPTLTPTLTPTLPTTRAHALDHSRPLHLLPRAPLPPPLSMSLGCLHTHTSRSSAAAHPPSPRHSREGEGKGGYALLRRAT